MYNVLRSIVINVLEFNLGNSGVEALSLDGCDFKLKRTWLARTIGRSNGTSTPWSTYTSSAHVYQRKLCIRTTVYFSEVGELCKRGGVTERDVDNTVVDQSGDGSQGSGFLSSSKTGSRREECAVFAIECAACPKATGGVPEGLKSVSETRQSQVKSVRTFHWAGWAPYRVGIPKRKASWEVRVSRVAMG